MPTYLVHGFRWTRAAIRIHIALYNLEDAAAEWIVAPSTSITLLNSFYTLYDFLPPSNPPLSPVAQSLLRHQSSGESTPTNGLARGGSCAEISSGVVNGRSGVLGRRDSGADAESSSGTSRGAGSCDEVAVGRGDGLAQKDANGDNTAQPYPVVKPHYVPLLPNSDFTNDNGKNVVPNGHRKTESGNAIVGREDQKPKVLTKKHTKSMSSLRSFGRRRTNQERPPDLPDLPVGSFIKNFKSPFNNNGNTNGNSTPKHEQSKRSTSNSIQRPSTAASESTGTSQSRTGNGSKTTVPQKKPSFNDWSVVKLLEQYDPNETRYASQPYAYVADYMVEVSLGVSLVEEQEKYDARIKAEAESIPQTPGPPSTPMTMGTRESVVGVGNGVNGVNGELSARDLRRRSRRLNWFEKLRDQLQKDAEMGWFVVVCGDDAREDGVCGANVNDDEMDKLRSPKSAGLRGLFGRKKAAVPVTVEDY